MYRLTRIITGLIATALIVSATLAQAQPPIPAWPVSVYDGDTFERRDAETGTARIRLACADAPEIKQPGGIEAKRHLESLVMGRWLAVSKLSSSFGRAVARVHQVPGGADVSAAMIEAGWAWADVGYRYCKDKAVELSALESLARREKRGLWGLPGTPIRPREWRRRK